MRRNTLSRPVAAPLIAVLLALGGCGSGNQAALNPAPVAPVEDSGLSVLPGRDKPVRLPDLPSGDMEFSAWRAVSDTMRRIDGKDRTGDSGHGTTKPDGTLVILPGAEDELAWATFRLGNVSTDRPTALEVGVQVILPGAEDELAYWVLLSDYSTMRWQATGPFTAPTTIPLNTVSNSKRYVSKQDGAVEPAFAYAIVTLGAAGNNEIDPPEDQPRIEISHGDTTVKPVADVDYLATDAHYTRILGATRGASTVRRASSASLDLEFEHISDPVAGGKCEAQSYQFARQGPGDTVAISADIDALLIGTLTAPINGTYQDPADNAPNTEPAQPGSSYRYYMRGATADGGYGGWAAFGSLITPTMPPVEGLGASTNRQDGILLEWMEVPGVKGYRLLRGTTSSSDAAEYITGTLPAEDSRIYLDLTADPDVAYTYWAIPVGEGATLDEGDDLDTEEEGAPLSGMASGIRQTPTAPIASIFIEVVDGDAPFEAQFDASASTDPDGGEIVLYEWDWETDGTYDFSDVAAQAFYTYVNPGVYTTTLRVTDDDGAEATTSIEITVRGWHAPLTLASSGLSPVGEYSSMATINGLPANAFTGAPNTTLHFAVNSAADGSGIWDVSEIVSGETLLSWVSLAEIGGRPAVSFIDDGDLRYAINALPDGSGTWTVVDVVAGPAFSDGTSLCALSSGNPAISAYNSSGQDSIYAYSSTATGSVPGDWSYLSYDGTLAVGAHSSLELVDGNPAISYQATLTGTLKYAWSTSADGAVPGDWTSVTVDAAGGLGQYTSLAVVDGSPAISYQDAATNALKYAIASTSNGADAGDWTTVVIDSTGGGFYPSLLVVDGRPAIGYYDDDPVSPTLWLAHALTADGLLAADWNFIPVAPLPNGWAATMTVLANGFPAAAYGGEFGPANYRLMFSSYH